ncbi:hypothetical protein [Saccharothrix sp. HUAS TT1]|uniref:hypothetical protein n=1 Tax=unclassified Saccharothrix TaxID=2593673 RepID=UPI00345C5425
MTGHRVDDHAYAHRGQPHHLLVADDALTVGDVLPEFGDDDQPHAATRDPRALPVTESLETRVDDLGLPALLFGAAGQPSVRIALVDPVGTVRPHATLCWPENQEEPPDRRLVDDPATPLGASGGWRITGFLPDLAPLLGPQAERIVDLVRQRQAGKGHHPFYRRVLDVEWEELGAGYATALLDTAVRALHARGLPGGWWASNLPATEWNLEVVALAARDLIGSVMSVPRWNQDAYDDMTRAWWMPFGPLHPDDAPPRTRAAALAALRAVGCGKAG